MKHFQVEFIVIIFFLGLVLLFLTANDFQIRRSENIVESFYVEKIYQNCRTNQTQPVVKLNGEESEYKPKRIVFIKTHKTGSSTIQNIFYRYALGKIEIRWFCIPVTFLLIVHLYKAFSSCQSGDFWNKDSIWQLFSSVGNDILSCYIFQSRKAKRNHWPFLKTRIDGY